MKQAIHFLYEDSEVAAYVREAEVNPRADAGAFGIEVVSLTPRILKNGRFSVRRKGRSYMGEISTKGLFMAYTCERTPK